MIKERTLVGQSLTLFYISVPYYSLWKFSICLVSNLNDFKPESSGSQAKVLTAMRCHFFLYDIFLMRVFGAHIWQSKFCEFHLCQNWDQTCFIIQNLFTLVIYCTTYLGKKIRLGLITNNTCFAWVQKTTCFARVCKCDLSSINALFTKWQLALNFFSLHGTFNIKCKINL